MSSRRITERIHDLHALEAALAEGAKYRAMWEEVARGCTTQAARVWECDPNAPVALNVEEAIDRLEAQIAALREGLQWCSGSALFNEGGVAHTGWLKLVAPLLTATADAAARCLARARQEGAEAMRERCVQRVEAEPELEGEPPSRVKAAMQTASPTDNARAAVRATKASIVAAIRALDAGDTAARRG